MSFVKVIIVGRLGTDPENGFTQSGAPRWRARIAADGTRKGEGTTWFSVTAYDRIAERLASLTGRGFLDKGALLYVEGQLESRTYTDRVGVERVSLDVTLTDFQFVGAGDAAQRRTTDEAATYDEVPF